MQGQRSLQERIKQRQQAAMQQSFVGRGSELQVFQQNLARPAEERDWFICNVFGQGGVGKTFLLQRFRQLAEDRGALTAWSDDTQKNIVEVMAHLADELEKKLPASKAMRDFMKDFKERHRAYRQRCQELESDPAVPKGFAEFLGKTLVRVGRHIPTVGVMFEFVQEDAVASLAGECAAYIARKLSNKDDIQLVREPVTVLTPLFLQGLWQAAGEHALVLFFDTYERTFEYVDSWLRDVLMGTYADIPDSLLISIAGRSDLDGEAWADLAVVRNSMPLESFTRQETREYLNRERITDARMVESIFNQTQGLPVLVALLAAGRPGEGGAEVDPQDTATDRFLKWVAQPEQRQIALDAALPRRFNQDVIARLSGDNAAQGLFSWLKEMPFVLKHADHWEYDQVVRTLMLRSKRHESPAGWTDIHQKMAGYYEALQQVLGLEESRRSLDPLWRRYALEALYHRLCEQLHLFHPTAIQGFLEALTAARSDFARAWAETMAQAEEDSDIDEALRWGPRLLAGLKAIREKQYLEAARLFTALLEQAHLGQRERGTALNMRGTFYHRGGHQPEALDDLSAALNIAPNEVDYLVERTRIFLLMRQWTKALEDISHAIAWASDRPHLLGMRAAVYVLLKRPDEALADLSRALEQTPRQAGLWSQRGLILLMMKRFKEALDDMNRALELEPENLEMRFERLNALFALGQHEQVAADYALLAEQAPKLVQQIRDSLSEAPPDWIRDLLQQFQGVAEWAATQSRAEMSFMLEIARGDLETGVRKIRAGALATQAFVHLKNQEPEEAVEAYGKALELTSEDVLVRLGLGQAYEFQGLPEKALSEYTRAIETSPGIAGSFSLRARLQLRLGHPREALADWKQACALEPDNLLHVSGVLGTANVLGMTDEYMKALETLGSQARRFFQQWKAQLTMLGPELVQQALGMQPPPVKGVIETTQVTPDTMKNILAGDTEELARQFQLYVAMTNASFHADNSRYEQALEAANQAVELAPSAPEVWTLRARLNMQLGHDDKALSDFDRALELNENQNDVRLMRIRLLRRMQRQDQALASLDRLLEWDPEHHEARVLRGVILSEQGHYDAALAEFDKVIEQRPDDAFLRNYRAQLHNALGQYEPALADLDAAVSIDASAIENWRFQRGRLSLLLEHYGDAVDAFKQVLEQEPTHPDAIYHLAVAKVLGWGAAAAQEELARARESSRSRLETTARDEALFNLGGLEAVEGHREAALSYLRQALATNPRSLDWVKEDAAWRGLREELGPDLGLAHAPAEGAHATV